MGKDKTPEWGRRPGASVSRREELQEANRKAFGLKEAQKRKGKASPEFTCSLFNPRGKEGKASRPPGC